MNAFMPAGSSIDCMLTRVLLLVAVALPCQVHAETADDHVLALFSQDYQEARSKFLDASHAIGLQETSYKLPEAGPQGRDLYLDMVRIGAKSAKTVLVIASGIHGVEGFAGSAIQTGLLQQAALLKLAPDVSVLMLHALNPYGFAHIRRANENNIDLNRNFIDHTATYPENTGYEELADAIAPRSLSVWNNFKARSRLLWYRLVNGKPGLQRAISSGQYTRPKGLFFGGNSASWTNTRLGEITRGQLSQAERVVYIDIHTGLGAHGEVEIIADYAKDSPQYRRATAWWGQSVRTPRTGESVSAPVYGTLNRALKTMLERTDLLAVAMEFGTSPLKEVFLALRAENWLHHYGGVDHPDAGEVKQELLRVFYPPEDEWKLAVWRQGRDIVTGALANLQRLPH